MTTATSAIKNLIFAIAMILPASALAQDHSRWEAVGLSCPNGNCGMRMMKLGGLEGLAKLQKVNIFENDDRKDLSVGEEAELLYVPTGVVKPNIPVPNGRGGLTSKNAQATGFLVSPCLAVLNYHSVFGDDKDGPDQDKEYSVTFTIRRGGQVFTARGTPVAHGGYKESGVGDSAVVRLDNCLGAREDIGWWEIAPASEKALLKVSLATVGYYSDKDLSKLHMDPSCKARGFADSDGTLLHDCANRPGTSGSPMYTVKDGVPYVVAFQSGVEAARDGVIPYSDEVANRGVMMSEVLNLPGVVEMIKEDRKKVPNGNPNKRRATNGQRAQPTAV